MTCIGENEAICDYCNRLIRHDSKKLIEAPDPITGRVFHACGKCQKSLQAIRIIYAVAKMFEEGVIR